MKEEIRLGRKIRIIRGVRSQMDFAYKLKISQPSLARYEKGVQTPKAPTLKRIAAAGNIPLDELLRGPLKPRKQKPRHTQKLPTGLSTTERKLLTHYRTITTKDRQLASLVDKLIAHLGQE